MADTGGPSIDLFMSSLVELADLYLKKFYSSWLTVSFKQAYCTVLKPTL
jgi:hypothetical protein